MKKLKYTIFLDCGDTIVDEATEQKDARGTTLRAELIPGAAEMVHGLVSRGYTLGLVADGPEDTFINALGQHNLYHFFSVKSISEIVGVSKPDPRMFEDSLNKLGIEPDHYGDVVMVGNNLERDIKGANRLGLVSVFLNWSPRRSSVPADRDETPDHTIALPLELLDLMDRLEAQAAARAAADAEVN
ncbi:MAG: HAD-IA family hydrolase [Spirochaetales bacterium]|jgi:HAD superfamily hydrolase (TIGR01549 family)|nr:HAD-IA family hydrolase [Spirochaetales bacterium]